MKQSIKTATLLLLAVLLNASCGRPDSDNRIADFSASNHLSSQQIMSFAEDCRGYIWIGTLRGLNRFNGRNYHQYFNHGDSLGIGNNIVNCLMADNQDNLWIGTPNSLNRFRYGQGIIKVADDYITMLCDTPGEDLVFGNIFDVWRVDKKTLQVQHCYSFSSAEYTNQFLTDGFGKLWAMEGNSVRCIDMNTGQIETQLHTEGNFLFAINLGNYMYIATDNGFQELNMTKREWEQPGSLQSLSETFRKEKVFKIFPYDSKSFLILTHPRLLSGEESRQRTPGEAQRHLNDDIARQSSNQHSFALHLYIYNTVTKELLRSDDDKFPFEVPKSEIQTIFVDSHKNIWTGTRRQGYKAIYNKQSSFNLNYRLTSFFDQRCISCLNVDNDGNLWIIADNIDLYRFSDKSGVQLIRREDSGAIDQVWTDSSGSLWMNIEKYVYCGYVADRTFRISSKYELMPVAGGADGEGNVYISSVGGNLYRKLKSDKEFKALDTGGTQTYVTKFLELRDGKLAMLDTDRGLYLFDSKTSKFDVYDLTGFSTKHAKFTDIAEDSRGKIWITSTSEGVFSIDLSGNGRIKHYDSDEYCHDACSVTDDEFGHIWIGTYEGLARLDITSERFSMFYKDDGISGNEFSRQCAVQTPRKNLIFGGIFGMTSVSPAELLPGQSRKLQMEYLSVDGKLLQDLTLNPEVNLEYDNVGADFSFTTLDYGGTTSAYQFQMEGFDPGVNTIRETDHAYYSHLPVGKYIFRVKAMSDSGENARAAVRVIVHPSVWGTPFMMWLVYPLLGLGAIAGAVYLLLLQYRHRNRMRAIILEKEQEQRANDLNMKFFSNISHEFRTPLTLINGALSMIEADNNDRLHNIMRSNTSRMMRLVNQLMDFNKMENGMLRLCVAQTDVKKFVEQTAGLFNASIKNRQIEFTLSLPEEPVNALIDRDKIEKVLVNLISNAIKYSNVGDSLTISLSTEDRDGKRWIKIDVADTGIGVPEDKREAIFRRFYQIEHKRQLPAIGTGIGLYYTRSLVELHHGQIVCLGNVPRGSVFSLSLPADPCFYSDDKKAETDAYIADSGSESYSSLPDEGTGEESLDQQRPAIMIVDDDIDVMNFLQMLLSPLYRTFTYSNATAAYSDIENAKPDLILSDVMMYEIDGYKFCKMVKDNSAFCHIPVILLTAKSSVSEQVEGLDCGAVAYITKPFSPQYLTAAIRSQLDFIQKLRNSLNASTQLKPDEQKVLQQADSEFMQALYKYFDEHLSEPELQIEEITRLQGMSRSKFFFKVKSLTGEAANVFFKTYKLNKAAEMILNSNEKLAYIAYATGFSSPSHFSLNFKKRFGMSPSEYKAMHSA